MAKFCLRCTLATALWFAAVGQSTLGQDRASADFPQLSADQDWPWWRGPTRNGVGADEPVPTQFSESSLVVWKSPVPGRGHSSPIIIGKRVVLSTADESRQIQSVLAFDRTTGKQLWQTEISRGGFPARNHPKNTEASPTIASDGQRLFVTFFHHEHIEITALDLNGATIWQKNVGAFNPHRYEYGYAPSPLLYRDWVIVAAEYDGPSFLVALNRADGREAWRTARPTNVSFSSPVVAHLAGRDQLLLSGNNQIVSYDPQSGKQLWTADGTTAATCGTMVWDGDTVFASGGYPKAETIAVKADGSGQVLWKNNQQCYQQSLLVTAGHVYALTDKGVLYCWRADDGREMWSERLRGPVSASPVLAGGHIYWANELGTLYVFRPNPKKFDLVAENKIGDEAFASPAVSGGQVFLRVAKRVEGQRREMLYCFGEGDRQ